MNVQLPNFNVNLIVSTLYVTGFRGYIHDFHATLGSFLAGLLL